MIAPGEKRLGGELKKKNIPPKIKKNPTLIAPFF
jgi:hypothetical protein